MSLTPAAASLHCNQRGKISKQSKHATHTHFLDLFYFLTQTTHFHGSAQLWLVYWQLFPSFMNIGECIDCFAPKPLRVKEHWPPHAPWCPTQTVAQCKCGQNSYPHKQVILCCRPIYFFQAFFILTKEIRPRETFTGNLAFSDTAQIEHVMVAIEKSELGKTRGWYVAAVGHNRRALHSRLSKGVAGKISGDHPGTSHTDNISGDMKIMPISGDTGGHQPMAKIVIGLTLHC